MERFVGKSQYHNHGQRVSCVWKGSAEVETMNTSAMTAYSRMCGATLARAHARSGDRIAIAATWAKRTLSTGPSPSSPPGAPTAEFSAAYADQNERDYQALVDAVNFRPGRRVLKPVCELCGYIRRGATG